MRAGIMALGVCVALASSPAVAQSSELPDSREPSGAELTLEGLTKLMLGLQRMVEELPRYNLPEIKENGDIIVRRADPHEKPGQPIPPVAPGKGVDL